MSQYCHVRVGATVSLAFLTDSLVRRTTLFGAMKLTFGDAKKVLVGVRQCLTVSVRCAELAVACIAEAGNDEGVLVQPLVN